MEVAPAFAGATVQRTVLERQSSAPCDELASNRARADARATPGGARRGVRGLRERRRAATRPGLPPGGRRARLRAAARSRGPARLLALALALPRRGRHLPPERQRRRGLRERWATNRGDRPAL